MLAPIKVGAKRSRYTLSLGAYDVKGASLFAYALILLKRLPDEESKRMLVDSIERVIEQYKMDIDMRLIGFPINYRDVLGNSIN